MTFGAGTRGPLTQAIDMKVSERFWWGCSRSGVTWLVCCAPDAHAQRPEGERREPPVRWTVMLGSVESLDNLVRPCQQRRRNRQAESPRGLEIDHQLELRRSLYGQLAGAGTAEDAVDVSSHTLKPLLG